MKRYFKAILFAASMLTLVCSCEKDKELGDPSVEYLLEYSFNQDAASTYTKSGDYYLFTANITDSSTGDLLKLVFVSSEEKLSSGTYTCSVQDYAKDGNYIIGSKAKAENSNFKFGKYNKQYNIKGGDATITNNGGTYSVEGTFGLSNGLYVKIGFNGAINFVYEESQEAPSYNYIELTNEVSLSAGDGYVTIMMGTEGITATPNDWGGINVGGTGNYLSLDIYSAGGTLADGTYTISSEEKLRPGEFRIGTITEVEYMGMKFTNYSGALWYTLTDGESEVELITSGEVTVVKSGDTYTVCLNAGNNGELSVRYIGSLSL